MAKPYVWHLILLLRPDLTRIDLDKTKDATTMHESGMMCSPRSYFLNIAFTLDPCEFLAASHRIRTNAIEFLQS
jgi:hypothetical protein